VVERGHRVLLPDTRGHGDSGLPRRPGYKARHIRAADMSLEHIAADLLEVCDDADVREAVFIGHSMGVQSILEVYREAPERVLALVAVAGPYENPMKTLMGQSYMDSLFPVAKFGLMAMPRLLLPAYRTLMNQHRFGTWGYPSPRRARGREQGHRRFLDRHLEGGQGTAERS